MSEQMPKAEAIEFFATLFGGEHHIPAKLREWGDGWCINDGCSRFSTYDFNYLTRLVFLAHDSCMRAEISPSGPRMIRIAIHKRSRMGNISARHPRLEEAYDDWRERHPETEVE